MKTCTKCQQEKPESEFYAGRARCKVCMRRDQKIKWHLDPLKRGAYEKQRQQDPGRRQDKARHARTHRQRNPEKYKARMLLNNAVRDGRVKKQPCSVCGRAKAQGHHTDYSKPLEVTWLCFACHRSHGHGQTVVSVYS